VGGVHVDHRDQLAQQMGVAQRVRRRRVAGVGGERVMHQVPVNPGSTPAASIGSVPRRRWQKSAVNRELQATCSQWPCPATRIPVSSACISSATVSAARTAAVNGASPAAPRDVQAVTVPVAIGVPNSSASNPAVRSTGRYWARPGRPQSPRRAGRTAPAR